MKAQHSPKSQGLNTLRPLSQVSETWKVRDGPKLKGDSVEVPNSE